MTLFRGTYRVESARLPNWDYGSAGWYFVTICTRDRRCSLGSISGCDVELSRAGEIVAEEWLRTGELRGDVELDEWIVMPNHLHGIVVIRQKAAPNAELQAADGDCAGDMHPDDASGSLTPGSLGAIMGQFKSVCTKRIRAAGCPAFGRCCLGAV